MMSTWGTRVNSRVECFVVEVGSESGGLVSEESEKREWRTRRGDTWILAWNLRRSSCTLASSTASTTATVVLEPCAASRRRLLKVGSPSHLSVESPCSALRTPELRRTCLTCSLSRSIHRQTRLFVCNRIKAMALSSTVTAFKCAAVFLAVLSSMAVLANGQAPGPAPPPETGGAGASAAPITILAPAIAMLVAFGLGHLQW